GLLTAVRLACSGHKVTVLDVERVGSGATCANHGMLHSGALYARQSPHIVAFCREAQDFYSRLAPEAEIPAGEAVYVLAPGDEQAFRTALDAHHLAHRAVEATDVPGLRASSVAGQKLVATTERAISSRRLLEAATAQCLAAGVRFVLGTAAHSIIVTNGRARAVRTGSGELLEADHIVLAAGLGTRRILAELESKHAPDLKSRLDMMMRLPGTLARGIIFTNQSGPVAMPGPRGSVLASLYGGIQPQIAGCRRFPVTMERAQLLLQQLRELLEPGTVDLDDATVYTVGKTDYVGTDHAIGGLFNPGHRIIDHRDDDGITGLHTICTGKMTLAGHASRDCAEQILGHRVALPIHPRPAPPVPDGLVAVEPWATVAA
ncbi:FAD-dependent oxidoreductase, partial [Kitasatospora sp. NPDC093558]|uniref:NAD(P)/FAD-dependent oxidoreductase n=1 Tax=Kitasatospora sp. NPDC093558 TaxID=3155201 RepID=UPI00343A8E64